MIAGLRFLWEESRTLQTTPPRDHRRGRSSAIKRTGPRPLSPHAFAPWDISFFSPKNKTCIFTGRSSDSASSPWPLLGMITNGLWPRLHFTAAVLSETCTPFPILPLARAVPERRRSGTCKYPCILLYLKYSICLSVLQYPLSRRERSCAVHHAVQPLPET